MQENLLTARDFLEVDELFVRPQDPTCREVAVDVALVQPGVVVTSETVGSGGAGFLAGLE